MNSFSRYTHLPATVIAAPVPGTYLLNNQDILRCWNVARRSLQRGRKNGLLLYYNKIAGKRFYKKSEVEASKNSLLMRLFICLFMQKTIHAIKKQEIVVKTPVVFSLPGLKLHARQGKNIKTA